MDTDDEAGAKNRHRNNGKIAGGVFPHAEVIVSVVSWQAGWPVQFSVPLCKVVICLRDG
jgi:hypothetical protein